MLVGDMSFADRVKKLLVDPRFLLVVYIVGAVFISVQVYMMGTHVYTQPKSFPADIMNTKENMDQFIGMRLTEYNNYVIFKHSFFHLNDTIGSNNYTTYGLHGLYGLHPTENWDFYKYSPTFAFLMGVLAYLPDLPGLIIWNLLNVLVVFFAVRMLPFSSRSQAILLWFIGNDMFTCLSNTQSNGLMCGLMVAAYCCMQNNKAIWATLWLALATYIKVYGAIGFCLFLFYPDKVKFVLYAIFWNVVLVVLPLVVMPLNTLIWQYHNWKYLIDADQKMALGISVAGWLKTWFHIILDGKVVMMAGAALFFLPFVRYKLYKDELYKILTLAGMMIWVIIFNHKAESSTYIIAVAGVGIWYFASPRATWRSALLLLVLVFTCLSGTDFFPPYVKKHFVYPYTIKAVPCIIVWCVIFVELMTIKPGNARGRVRLAGGSLQGQ